MDTNAQKLSGDNINKHIGDGNENVTNDNRNVNKEEGFELTDTLADDLHRLFLTYVDSQTTELLGIGQFIAFVCNVGLEKYCNVDEVKVLFDASCGSLNFSGFLQSLGTLATSRYANEKNFAVAMNKLIVNYVQPIIDQNDNNNYMRNVSESVNSEHQDDHNNDERKNGGRNSSNIDLSEGNIDFVPSTSSNLMMSPGRMGKIDQNSTSTHPILGMNSLYVKLSQVKEVEGEYDITYCFRNKDKSNFVVDRKYFEPLRQVFAYYSVSCNSSMRVPLFGEIQRNQVQDRMYYEGFRELLMDANCIGDDVKDGDEITDKSRVPLTMPVVEQIFRKIQLNFMMQAGKQDVKSSSKDPFGRRVEWQKKGRDSGRLSPRQESILSNSIRNALGKTDDRIVQSIKERHHSMIDFRTFLVGLAHIAVSGGNDSAEHADGDLLPLSIENLIKRNVLVSCFRREPTIPRLRPAAIFQYLDLNMNGNSFIHDILRRKGVRFGFQGLYLHYSTHWHSNRHRYTEAKSRSGLIASPVPEEIKSIKHWELIFRQIDGDRDGYLNLNQVCLALKRLKQPLNFFQIEDWMVRVGKPCGDELGVSFETFVAGFGQHFDLDNKLIEQSSEYFVLSNSIRVNLRFENDSNNNKKNNNKLIAAEDEKFCMRSRFSGMNIKRAIEFAKDFEICPALLSEAECRGIYTEVATMRIIESTASSLYHRYNENDKDDMFWRRSHGEMSIALDYERFVTFVFSLANRALGKYPFNSDQSSFSEKVLLLLWRIEHSKKGKRALALKSSTKTILGHLPSTVPISTRQLRTNPSRMSFVNDLGVRPGVWETLNKKLNTKTERALWASMAATKRRKSNVASPKVEGSKSKSVFFASQAKKSKNINKKKSENLRMKREAAERRNRGEAWSGYSLDTVNFKKKSIGGSSPVDESIYHKRGAYMGRHWRKNKARQKPQDNRARFVKSLTSHGLRSSGTRKEARNATVRHHAPTLSSSNQKLMKNDSYNASVSSLANTLPPPPPSPPPAPSSLYKSPSDTKSALSTPLPSKSASMDDVKGDLLGNGNSSNGTSVDSTMKAWDAELANELKKLRAELNDAVGSEQDP